jgi:DNA-binding transcriptional ArsR family regulator
MADSGRPSADHAAVLEAVGNETRVGIVKALIDHRRETPRDPGLSFSALRDRVGVADSGRFNYHLDILRDQFVTEDDGEYTLTYAGRKLAVALLTGTFHRGTEDAPVEYGTCPRADCEATLVASYDDGDIVLECQADHTAFKSGLPPGTAADRSMDEILALVTKTLYHDLDLATDGICPQCYGRMETAIVKGEHGTAVPVAFEGVCQQCGFLATGAAGVSLLTDPDVTAFFHDQGRDIGEEHPWELEFITDETCYTVVSEDPLRVRVGVRLVDEELRATVDETATVVDTQRSGAAN